MNQAHIFQRAAVTGNEEENRNVGEGIIKLEYHMEILELLKLLLKGLHHLMTKQFSYLLTSSPYTLPPRFQAWVSVKCHCSIYFNCKVLFL